VKYFRVRKSRIGWAGYAERMREMKNTGSSDMLVPIYQTTRHHFPEVTLLLMRNISHYDSVVIFGCGE
jgi:hypothetical protein